MKANKCGKKGCQLEEILPYGISPIIYNYEHLYRLPIGRWGATERVLQMDYKGTLGLGEAMETKAI